MKHLKNLGLVALAIAAFTAFAGASSASAAEFHATAIGTSIHGSQSTSHKFTTTGSSITCTTATFTGKTEAITSTTQKVHPEYSGCTAFGFVGATVNTAGCEYVFHTNGNTVDIINCTNGGIIVTASSAFGQCVMQVPNQTGINGQAYATAGSAPNRHITATTNSTNIKDKVTVSTGICPISVGQHTNASYTGTTTMKAASGEIWYQ